VRSLIFLGVLPVAGCSSGLLASVPPTASSPASSASSGGAALTASPVPEGPTSGSVERDGVRLTLEIEQNPLSVHMPAWATVTAENVGADAVVYGVGGCGLYAQVSGRIVGDWTAGLPQVGPAGAYKAMTLEGEAVTGSPALGVGLVPESLVGLEDAGCADLLQLERLEAGASEMRRALWRGDGTDLVPTNALELIARFPFFRRERDPEEREGPPIEVSLSAGVLDAPPSPLIGPGPAIDAALGQSEFGQFVAAYPQEQWINPYLELDREHAVWTVGLFVNRGPPDYEQFGSVRVAATSGLVLGVKFDPPFP
jgi:hypothetical protein